MRTALAIAVAVVGFGFIAWLIWWSYEQDKRVRAALIAKIRATGRVIHVRTTVTAKTEVVGEEKEDDL